MGKQQYTDQHLLDSNEKTSLLNSRIKSSPPTTTPATTPAELNRFHHRRFAKQVQPKINCAKTFEDFHRLDVYLEQKAKLQSPASLTFESELFQKPTNMQRIANEPFRQRCSHPWKYFFSRRNYQTCSDQFRRVRSTCIDLSRY